VQNGVLSPIVLQFPTGIVPPGHTVGGLGISEDGTKICALWTTTSSGNMAYVALHNLNGTVFAAYSTGMLFNDDDEEARIIDNGWVVFSAPNALVACKATPTLQGLKTLSTDDLSFRLMSNNVSDDGHIYYTTDSSDDLYKVNVETGIVSVYPEVFARYVGGSATKTHDILCYSMHAISGSKVVFGGQYQPLTGQPDVGNFYPIYCAVVIDGGNANVSDSIYTEYATTSGGVALVGAMTSLTNGDVAYAIYTNAPYDDFLVKVTGP
jgi:hypothetical protein